jgi:nucleoside-diphosphate-sugar epimerase
MMSVPYVFLREAISRGAIEVWSKNVAGKSVIAERDFLDVRDLVSIVTRLMTKNFPEYHIVEIGSGKSYSFLEIAQRVSSLVTCKVSVVDLPNYVRPEFYQTSTISNLNTLQYILGGIEFFELDSTIAYIKEKEVNFLE